MKRKSSKPAVIMPAITATDLALPAGRPTPIAVYLQAKPTMEPNLRVILTLLKEPMGVRAFPWHDLRFEHLSAIRTLLADNLAPAYARKCLVAARGVLRTAWKMRVIDTETYQRAIDVDPIPGDSAQAGRMLTPKELRRLFGRGQSPRDLAILAVATFAGLRREEIARLDLDSIEGNAIHVLGKGARRRDVFLPAVAMEYLRAWIEQRGKEPGPLFWRCRPGGLLSPNRRLTPPGVSDVIVSAAKLARVTNVTAHDFRRTFASTLFDQGVDPVTVQKLMGHGDPKTTARYDRRGDEKKKAAAEALAEAFEDLL